MVQGSRNDAEIQKSVLRELLWDTRVEPTDVGVEVDAGVVTLTGTVTSWSKRIAAQEAAHRVLGVRDVANDIDVRVPGSLGRTDTEIAQAVRNALEWNVLVPHDSLRSTVSKGWVTLDGTVETWAQRDDAEQAVRNLAGVGRVVNKLSVQPPVALESEVRDAIEGALERRAEREARRISLEVKPGHVVLSGTVQSWPEKESVLGAVKGTRGVGVVEDRLRVSPLSA